jgi:SPP1 family predicted phage head-tail adaptor
MTRYRINPGEYRHVITFQKKTSVQDSYGEKINDWVDVVKTRAGIYPINGKEFFAAETTNNQVTHKINIRYLPGITPDMQIKYGNRIFEVIAPPINFQERNIQLQLLCKEVI